MRFGQRCLTNNVCYHDENGCDNDEDDHGEADGAGDAGASWSEDDVSITRERIFAMIRFLHTESVLAFFNRADLRILTQAA